MIQYITFIYWILIVLSYLLARKLKFNTILWSLCIYLVLFSSCEVAEFYFDVPVWDQTERTSNCYDWFEQYLEKNYDTNKDYSEGIFNNNYTMSAYEATINKYDHIFNKLNLKPGMTLLDAGCGTGVWMEYCRDRGVKVVGMTLSAEQAIKVREKGLTVYVMDYRVPYEPFFDQFDRITALGSSEHICSSKGSLIPQVAKERCNQIRIDTWKLLGEYLKSNGKCYITMLTGNQYVEYNMFDWFQAYTLERHYGGFYSTFDDIQDNIVPYIGMDMNDVEDKTNDYFWTSIIDEDHFGRWSIKWDQDYYNKIEYIFKGLVTDPFLAHHWMYYFMDTWMWQFERGEHFTTPIPSEYIELSSVQLKYFLLEKH